uniref:HTH CENPB-type domain-containing protein n=1 Tax=Bionectria ochroleuca TaxID=29856 RepID=A0A0B7JUF4_BIOOC
MAETGTDPAAAGPDTTDITPVPDSSHPKERHSLTLDQRRSLRKWANEQPVRPSHKACIDWFFAQYGHQISQSTVSHSLSPKYSRLDSENPQLSGSRLRFGNWPDVEKLVLRWYQQVQASGRQPTNEELGEKAKSIFNKLPRYKEEASPEFSPGWIHRFKKRYGLLIRRQRRHGEGGINPAEDIGYLADYVPRFMTVVPDTSLPALKDQILRAVGVEASLSTYDDPEVVLQNALRQLQQEEQAAEEQAAAVREERERQERAGLAHTAIMATPNRQTSSDPRYATPAQDMGTDLTLTPIHSDVPISTNDKPIRCPFCVNLRMLRTIKEAVEHMSTHVVV